MGLKCVKDVLKTDCGHIKEAALNRPAFDANMVIWNC